MRHIFFQFTRFRFTALSAAVMYKQKEQENKNLFFQPQTQLKNQKSDNDKNTYYSRMQIATGSVGATGSSAAQLFSIPDFIPIFPPTTLKQMVLHSKVENELSAIIDYLSNRAKEFAEKSIKVPLKIFLTSEPGLGKSELINGLAGHAGVPLLSISAASLLRPEVGRTEMFLSKLFENAKDLAHEYGGCIIALEEIDTLATNRTSSSLANWKIDMLNHLLTLMDTIQLPDGVVVIFTTNFPNKLDDAFLRSGRIDLTIRLSRPEKNERIALFKLFLKNKSYNANILVQLGDLSRGMTGADIRKWIDKAYVQAINRTNINKESDKKSFFSKLLGTSLDTIEITFKDFEDSLHLVYTGIETKQLSQEAILNHAKHESAHLLIAHLLNFKVNFINLHETHIDSENEKKSQQPQTIQDLKKFLQVAMAPFTEELHCKDILGHELDLIKARTIARELLLNEAYTGKFNMTTYELEEEINRILTVTKQENDVLLHTFQQRNPNLYEHCWKTLAMYQQLYKEDIQLILEGKTPNREAPKQDELKKDGKKIQNIKLPSPREPNQIRKRIHPVSLTGTKVFLKWGIHDVCEAKKTATGKLCLLFVDVSQSSAVKVVEFFKTKGVSMDYQDKMFIIHEESVGRFLRLVQSENLLAI